MGGTCRFRPTSSLRSKGTNATGTFLGYCVLHLTRDSLREIQRRLRYYLRTNGKSAAYCSVPERGASGKSHELDEYQVHECGRIQVQTFNGAASSLMLQ